MAHPTLDSRDARFPEHFTHYECREDQLVVMGQLPSWKEVPLTRMKTQSWIGYGPLNVCLRTNLLRGRPGGAEHVMIENIILPFVDHRQGATTTPASMV